MWISRALVVVALFSTSIAFTPTVAKADVVDPADAVEWPNHVLFSRTDAGGTHIFRIRFIPGDDDDITPVQDVRRRRRPPAGVGAPCLAVRLHAVRRGRAASALDRGC